MANEDPAARKDSAPPAPPRKQSVPPPRASAPPPPPKRKPLPSKPPPEPEPAPAPEPARPVEAARPSPPPPAAPAGSEWGDDGGDGVYASPSDLMSDMMGGSAPPPVGPSASPPGLSPSASPPGLSPSASPPGLSPSASPPGLSPSVSPPAEQPRRLTPAPSYAPSFVPPAPSHAQPEKKGSGAIVALVVVLVLLVGGFVAYLALGTGGGPGSVVGAVAPASARVLLNGRPLPTSGGRYEVRDLEPGPYRLEFSAEGHAPQTTTVTVEPGEATVVNPVILVATAPATPAKTGLAVRVRPEGATILVDGQPRPETTPTDYLPLPAGSYTVRFEKAGFEPLTRAVALAPGTILPIEGELAAAGVAAPIASLEPATAACTLAREGQPAEAVGRAFSVPLEGAAILRCTAEGHDAMERELRAPPGGEPLSLEVRLRPLVASAGERPAKASKVAPTPGPEKRPPATKAAAPAAGGEGFLSVATRPWTKVYIDGRLVGNTPVLRHSVPAGQHRLILINEDFNIRESLTVRVAAGETKQVVRNMVQ